MLVNYLKIAVRNRRKRTFYSVLNRLRLATGITACLLIILISVDELRSDGFHSKAGRLYRVGLKASLGNYNFEVSVSPVP
jgi:putative ABC transport system permease protein